MDSSMPNSWNKELGRGNIKQIDVGKGRTMHIDANLGSVIRWTGSWPHQYKRLLTAGKYGHSPVLEDVSLKVSLTECIYSNLS